ncbi:ABC transporter permease [Fusibacter ferrireducens]|uniref:ABC transporter permease n=1 Tax=Fusibacter ferrireducens TaxID=2785058 RepID=A0ABR9ZNS7_9FIRM|nr:ABC transporter permease [Fusibacter ferrireducens]MBF4691575.1 ABC transporter permease [Fusibacter ferrireducens]
MINSIAFLIGATLMYSTPILFTALGGLISEKSGIVNIGLEGMMVAGAFSAAAVTTITGNPWFGLMAGSLTSGTIAFVHGLLSVYLGANQIVSGVAINFLGPAISLFMCKQLFNGSTNTPTIDTSEKLPKLFANIFTEGSFLDFVFHQDITVYLALFLVLVIGVFLNKTIIGLRIKSVGEHPKASETLGINVYHLRVMASTISGAIVGIGGASMSIALSSHFSPTLIAGQGFIALAAVIFGKWKVTGVLNACLLFGFTQSLVIFIGGTDLEFPSKILSMLPYFVTIITLIIFKSKSSAPKALGIPYER